METAVLKVISDIIDAADCQKVTLLALLDMSAAFDTVDHSILFVTVGQLVYLMFVFHE